MSSVSLPLSTAAYAGPALAGGPARRLPRVDVKCSIYGCYSMTDGLDTPRKLCRFAELRPTLMSGDSNIVGAPFFPVFPARSATGDPRLGDQRAAEAKTGHPPSLDRTRAVSHAMSARHAFKIPHPNWHTLSVWPILAWLPYVDTLVPALQRPRRTPSGSARLHARPPPPARGPWPDP